MKLAFAEIQCAAIIKIITEFNNAFIFKTNLMVKILLI